ncbi:MAG: entericidin EcnA/B family protein [Rhodobacteraceae bacterium]|nr:entericidin EcnA/B family protein [Paracoccaceae bacterium]
MLARIVAVAALVALAACNTVEGIGEDVSAGARSVRSMF